MLLCFSIPLAGYNTSMDFRTRHQLAVFTAALLIVGAAAGSAYLVYRPPPTCFDGRLNQAEEEVDCGGSCVSCALRHAEAIEIFWVRFVKVRENSYDVAAEIANPNGKLGATSFAYEFKLSNTAGEVVAVRQDTAYIYPGEIVHLAEVGLLSDDAIRNVTLTLRNVRWALTESPGPNLIVGGREYVVTTDGALRRSTVRAIVSNQSVDDVPDLQLAALVFDTSENLMGVHRTVLDGLAAGAAEALTFMWPAEFPDAISSILIEVRSPAALPPAEP